MSTTNSQTPAKPASVSQTLAADAKATVTGLESAAISAVGTAAQNLVGSLLGGAQPASVAQGVAGAAGVTPATLTAQEQAAVTALASDVGKLTGQTAAQVLPFATKFAPDAIKWAALLAEYEASGNHALYVKQASNLRILRDAIILQAADLGVNLQSAGEQTLIDTVENAAKAAVSAAAKAVL